MKSLLQRCLYEKRKMQSLQKRLDVLKDRACSPSGIHYSDTPRGRGEQISSVQAYIEQAEPLAEEMEVQAAICGKLEVQAERVFSKLPEKQKALMTYRYIDGLEWEQIQDKMGINGDQSKKLHYAAKNKLFPKKA